MIEKQLENLSAALKENTAALREFIYWAGVPAADGRRKRSTSAEERIRKAEAIARDLVATIAPEPEPPVEPAAPAVVLGQAIPPMEPTAAQVSSPEVSTPEPTAAPVSTPEIPPSPVSPPTSEAEAESREKVIAAGLALLAVNGRDPSPIINLAAEYGVGKLREAPFEKHAEIVEKLKRLADETGKAVK